MGSFGDHYEKEKKEKMVELSELIETRETVLRIFDEKIALLKSENETYTDALRRTICQNHNLRG